LRVPFRVTLTMRRARGIALATCHDFGGGGCAVSTDEKLDLDSDVWLDGADLEGEQHPLHGRATVVWARLPTNGEPSRYGLRFAIDSSEERDQIDRVLYRLLDLFLRR
jgi:hypothetical protein